VLFLHDTNKQISARRNIVTYDLPNAFIQVF